jgi:hypothetical protein
MPISSWVNRRFERVAAIIDKAIPTMKIIAARLSGAPPLIVE